MRNPSSLEILWSFLVSRNNNTVENISINKSIIWKLSGVMVPNIATGIPITIQILNILLPIIFPTIRSVSLWRAATMVVTNSGRDVPSAITVSAITLSDTPIVEARKDALFTTNWLPKTNPANPIIARRNDLPSLY